MWRRGTSTGDKSSGLSRLCFALSVGSALAVAALLTLVGFELKRSYDEAFANAITDSQNFARLLEGHAQRTVRAVDQTLIGVQKAVAPRPDAPPLSDTDIQKILVSLFSPDSEFRNLAIADTSGDVVHSAVPLPEPFSIGDRSYFLAHRDRNDAGLFVSEPFDSRTRRGLAIALSRRLENLDDSFAGVIAAIIDVQHFQRFYASMALSPGGTLSLWNRDGIVLARYPYIEGLIGRPPPENFTYRGLRDSDPPAGTIRLTTVTDGVERIFSYRRLPGTPLTVMSSYATADITARWRREAVYFGGPAALLAIAIVVLTWIVVRELTRREQVEFRFASLVANVPGVVYRRRQGANGAISYPWISRGVEDLLGWTKEEIESDSDPLLEAIHPDDQAACKAAHSQSAAAMSPINWEARVRTKSGRFIWVQSISQAHRTKDGAVEWDGVLVDITRRREAAEQAAADRRLLDQVIDSVPAMIGVKDLDRRYLLINKGLAAELGCSNSEAIGRRRDDFPLPGVAADERAKFYADVQAREERVLTSGVPSLFQEERIGYLDGTQQTKLSSKIPLLDHGGRIYALLTVTIDISDRTRAELALDHSRQLLRSVVDAVPATVSVKDLQLRYILVNQALAAHLGCRPEDAIGRTLSDFTVHQAVPEESAKMAAHVTALERQLLAEGRPRLNHEETVRLVDGTYWTGLSSKVPLRDSKGQVYALLTVVIDISDRKRAEQALQQSRQLLQDVIDAVPAAIAVKDRDLRFILVNRGFEQMYHRPASEIIGRRTGEFRGAENATQIEQIDRQVLNTGRAMDFREVESRAADDRGHTYWLGKMPLRNTEGEVFGTVGVALDITERKITEEKLRQAQKLEAIGQLTGGLAHDFNNLLSIILGNLELLSERLQGQEQLRQLANIATRATLRGADLTQRLLAYARRQPLQPRRTDVNQLVSDVAEILTRTLGETIQLETRLDASLWPVQIDPSQLENAIINLAVNARDAMPKGGSLTVETTNADIDGGTSIPSDEVAAGQYVVIAVTDTGHGMDRPIIERAFEPFFTTKETGKGSGLGLSMVYGFVRQSGGYVKIYSEVGRGTTVRLYLRRAAGDEVAAPAPRAQDGMPMGKGERLLIVEDNPAVQSLVVHMVHTLGYNAVAAADGPSALALLNGCGFDLLLTDVILPRGMGGPALAREARTLCPALKVIYMSGYTESALLRDNALEPQAILVSKPFRKVELARRLREMLDSRAPA